MPITTRDLTRILRRLKQARSLLDTGREIAAKAEHQPLTTLLSELVAVLDSGIRQVDVLRDG